MIAPSDSRDSHVRDVRSHWLTVAGLQVQVREAGAGDCVVFVHGLGVSSTYFERLSRLLAGGHRVLAPDLPGWGGSERPPAALDIASAADVLGDVLAAEDAVAPTLVGNSLGCQIVVELAHTRPDLARSIVLIGPTVDPHYRTWLRQAGTLLLDLPREPRALWPIIGRDYLVMGVPRLLATARHALADRPEEKLSGLAAPVLVIRGDRDAITTLGWAERCASLARRGTLARVPAAAHAAHFSHPERVAELIDRFLAERRDRSD